YVFNLGWYPQHHSRIADVALSILEESSIDPNVLKKAKGMGLSTAHSVFNPKKLRKKEASSPKWGDDPNDDASDLDEMDFNELSEFVYNNPVDLGDVDLDDFQVSLMSTEEGRTERLREAIFDSYYPDYEEESDEEESDEEE
ncbi:unnamed protein product, partial [marine sediment metagenome]